ncbi:enoyl-CoA hydratase/isomerase family protein [Palleronia caenipelagi]|uniref:Enoyl-CoA hydratase/isomerase family protein n=1 Tax=Palleronia caenipelagi TaxID=2489174 RepID=A0A547Q8A8_9RHOB|nr:enoyl-CoA hydratase/isomerase family protein [Palleronia caenipelagi]TRD22615.1 enoyl-CoA hydratase/isomerase family protein [Palleronia caenipelagi]
MGLIETRVEGGLCHITLNRPDKANALSSAMLEQLVEAVQQANARRALILTGSGSVFSAGADLKEAAEGLATSPLWEKLSAAVSDYPGLSIAALNGPCAGGAMGMVLAADLRIAMPTARFFYPVMRMGYLPQPSDVPRLTRLIGPARAKLILMGGAKVSATEALQFGLIDRITEDIDAEIASLTKDLCVASPDHAAAIRQMIVQTTAT